MDTLGYLPFSMSIFYTISTIHTGRKQIKRALYWLYFLSHARMFCSRCLLCIDSKWRQVSDITIPHIIPPTNRLAVISRRRYDDRCHQYEPPNR